MSHSSSDLTPSTKLTSEEKNEYDELIEKLFPKCRPRGDNGKTIRRRSIGDDERIEHFKYGNMEQLVKFKNDNGPNHQNQHQHQHQHHHHHHSQRHERHEITNSGLDINLIDLSSSTKMNNHMVKQVTRLNSPTIVSSSPDPNDGFNSVKKSGRPNGDNDGRALEYNHQYQVEVSSDKDGRRNNRIDREESNERVRRYNNSSKSYDLGRENHHHHDESMEKDGNRWERQYRQRRSYPENEHNNFRREGGRHEMSIPRKGRSPTENESSVDWPPQELDDDSNNSKAPVFSSSSSASPRRSEKVYPATEKYDDNRHQEKNDEALTRQNEVNSLNHTPINRQDNKFQAVNKDELKRDSFNCDQLKNAGSQKIKTSGSLPILCDSSHICSLVETSSTPSHRRETDNVQSAAAPNITKSSDESGDEENLIIGNVPIAKYSGSPRRYGPKLPLLVEQFNEKETTPTRSRPGYLQRVLVGSLGAKKSPSSSFSMEQNIRLPSLSCDELVKSILDIPISLEDSLTPHHKVESAIRSFSPDIAPSSMCDVFCDNNNDRVDVPAYPDGSEETYPNKTCNENKNYPESASHVTTSSVKLFHINDNTSSSYQELMKSNSETPPSYTEVKSSDSSLFSRKDLYPAQEKAVHQSSSQFVSRSPAPKYDYPITREMGGEEGNLRNFSLSPEVTDCDSNEIESEFSIEGSLYSLSKNNAMPVLEDGLSSGIPSSDNELDDDSFNDHSVSLESSIDQANKREKDQISRLKETAIGCTKERMTLYADKVDYPNANDLNTEKDTLQGYPGYHSMSEDSHAGRLEDHLDLYEKSMDSRQMVDSGQNFRRTRSLQLDQANCQSFPGTVNTAISESNFQSSYESESDPRKIINLNQAKSNYEKQEIPKINNQQDPSHLNEDCDTDQETDALLGAQRAEDKNNFDEKTNGYSRKKNNSRENFLANPSVLIEGVLFRARYLGSTQLICNGQPTKATRMMQAEEAVSRIKAPEGESQPSTEVDLFISTEKIMVLNTDLKEIMMDHALRTISYIADIGDLLVLMTRRRVLNPSEDSNDHKMKRSPKMICHVFESEEAQFIAQSIGQAFQVAYMEFLKANGIEDSSFVKEMDYQEVLNSQEIFGNELEMFAKKDRQKEVIIPKQKGEILGMVIVESGWGSMLPTVVIANMAQQGPAARCGQLNIGDQIIAINGISLVGLPLSTCQTYVKNAKYQTAVKMTVVPCAPVVEVKIKRPDTKYQLGFSVQNGVICSLLRGGIAERGGVRVGHRIIEINGQSVVAVPHERIVNLLATSVGEIAMKTMPTSMFRLLTGQESPAFI